MSGLTRRAALAGGLAGALTGCGPWVREPQPRRPLRVEALPLASFRSGSFDRRFGRLEFLSGVELVAEDHGFGGLSAFRLREDGRRFLAVTDEGNWLSGEMLVDGGRIIGLGGVEIAPLLDEDGAPLAARGAWDAESLALAGDIAFVGVEVENAILRYNLATDGLAARGTRIAIPPAIAGLDEYRGLEAMAVMPLLSPFPGAILAVAEDGPASGERIPAFILGPEGQPEADLTIRKEGRFRVTDIAFAPNGDLLILERAQSISTGIQTRLRRARGADVIGGAVLEPETLFGADQSDQVDNFEGLAAHRAPTGDTILTMVSDNNFSAVQRTLLLQWRLVEDAA
jgi:hypothetical protein